MPDDKPLLLVDGSSYLFRAFHALPPLSTSDGRPTGAIRGVVSMLRKLAKDYQGSPIAVVFDAKGKTFRDDIYPEYKAHRPPMPDELRAQIEPLQDIIRAMGIPLIIQEGVEADDVIGTLAREAEREKRDTVISTSDKDMAQLVGPHVTLVDTMSNTTLDREGVVEKFGVTPEQIIDYLALMGDASDNIPGVPKVGPKTAAKWLKQYGNLEEIIRHANEIKGKVGENLRANLDKLPLSKTLTTIVDDVDLGLSISDLTPKPPDTDKLREWFESLEFRSWLEEMSGAGNAADEGSENQAGEDAEELRDYTAITTIDELKSWIQRLGRAELFAFDTETTSLDYMQAELVGCSFSMQPGQAVYLPLGHDYPGAPDQIPLEHALNLLKPLLESAQALKVGQNLKYDKNVLARYEIKLAGIAFDTMLESYVLNSVATRHNMDALAQYYLGVRTIHFEDIAGKGVKQLTFNQVPVETAATYAAEDADITLKLHETLWPRLQKEAKLMGVFQEIEMPLLTVLSRIERTGALVDGKLLARQSEELSQRLAELTQAAWEIAGENFNLDSPKQLQEILFGKLGLPILKKTPGGKPSTAEAVLQELALEYELPHLILEYRGLAKLKSTYTDKLPEQIDPETGRIHTSYHQAVAATGRLSSSDPNLQNIPVRTAEGRRIRQAFIAPSGRCLVAADYSQIELRIMAHLSEDTGLISAFEQHQDIHRHTAAEVFGCDPDQVTDDQRRSAKAINFGLIYGMSAFGLARQLGTSRVVAQDYIDRYFERYPGVLDYMEVTRQRAREQGYVETVFGRRLYLPEINAGNGQRRQAAERTAINAPMQGTAADIIKRAMISVQAWLTESGLDAPMIMQVHDELVFEVGHENVGILIKGATRHMESAAELKVPLVVDVGQGENWDEAH